MLALAFPIPVTSATICVKPLTVVRLNKRYKISFSDYPDDDLALGAEAKSMSPGNSLSPYSPRLSPIGCIDDNEFSPRYVCHFITC